MVENKCFKKIIDIYDRIEVFSFFCFMGNKEFFNIVSDCFVDVVFVIFFILLLMMLMLLQFIISVIVIRVLGVLEQYLNIVCLNIMWD